MTDPASEQLQRRLNRMAWIAVPVLVAVTGVTIALSRSPGVHARQVVREQVAQIKAGAADQIHVCSRVEMDEFSAARHELDGAHPFDLSIDYANGVDEFLRQIADQVGLRRLVLQSTDVSAAGLESVAALPDLEKLTINYIQEGGDESGEWLRYLPAHGLVEALEPLATAPKLKELVLYTHDVPAEEIKELRGRLTNLNITLPRNEKQRKRPVRGQ